MFVPMVAHVGQWLANLLYLVPVLVLVGAIFGQRFADKRAAKTKLQRLATAGNGEREEP